MRRRQLLGDQCGMMSSSSFTCRFHPLVGDASPLMWSAEDEVSGEGAQCFDALPQLVSPNYCELWWNMRDMGRIIGRDDTPAGQISQIRKDGRISRNGRTTAQRDGRRVTGYKKQKIVCTPKRSRWIPFRRCLKLSCKMFCDVLLRLL